MKKFLVLAVCGLMLLCMLAGCGSSGGGSRDPLAGEWKKLDYRINEYTQKIEWTEQSILFENGRVTIDGSTYLYNLSRSEGSATYDSFYLKRNAESTGTQIYFNITNNGLLLEETLYYKVGSAEYQQYEAEMQAKAQKELDELLAQIKQAQEEEAARIEAEKKQEEERVAAETRKEESLAQAQQLWEEFVNQFINDYDTAVSAKQAEIRNEICNRLEGTWVREDTYNSYIYQYTYTYGTFAYQKTNRKGDYLYSAWSGIVEVYLNPYFEYSRGNGELLSGDKITTEFKEKMLSLSPFNANWRTEDLEDAASVIASKKEEFYAQIEKLSALSLEDLIKNRTKDACYIACNANGTIDIWIDITSFTETKYVTSNQTEYFKQ